MKFEVKTLGELNRDYQYVLFDKSAIQDVLLSPELSKLEEVRRESHLFLDFAEKLRFLKNLYLPREIWNELCPSRIRYKEYTKKNDGDLIRIIGGEEAEEERNEIIRTLGKVSKLSRILRGRCEEKDRVFRVSPLEKEAYNKYENTYSDLKSKYDLSLPDYDLLISSLVCFKMRSDQVAIISNDFGIGHSWEELTHWEEINRESLNFYVRTSKSQYIPFQHLRYNVNNNPEVEDHRRKIH